MDVKCKRLSCLVSIMQFRNEIVFLMALFSLSTATFYGEDYPCAAQQIPGKSVVCVCNVTYCDTITRVPPAPGSYVAYTSSEGGLRFHKTIGKLESHINTEPCPGPTFTLNPGLKYQEVEGFGSAVTDAAGIMWTSIPEPLQTRLIDSYYSDHGLQYNMIRVPIGGTDFSTHPYAYNEYPPYDVGLSNFSLSIEDYHYKIPMIKAIMKASREQVHIIASTWSPPLWMKTNNAYIGYSRLLPEYYQTYADYHLKFLEKYAAAGVPIWGITTGNEPSDGMSGSAPLNCLGWNADSLASWIIHNLGPTIRHSSFKDIKILCGDDQRPLLPYWITLMLRDHPKVLEYIDGIAVHFYFDNIVPPTVLSDISKQFPGKFIIGTEATVGGGIEGVPVDLGEWKRAVLYIVDIINDINHSVVGWIDWNMCLNKDGGPNWNFNSVDSPIIVMPEIREFVKQPTYYAMGHFSKFVPRGSRRIQVIQNEEASAILNVAFVTPHSTVVIVLYNQLPSRANVVLGKKSASIQLEPNSITTIELPYNQSEIIANCNECIAK